MQSTGHTSTQAVSLVPMHGSQMIYATTISSKPWQVGSITRRTALPVAVLVLWACTELPSAPPQGGRWKEAPEYLSLLTPPAYRSAYRIFISPNGFEETVQYFLTDPPSLHPPGAWQATTMSPYDAFGLTGGYNRWKVAGLYRSRRVRVARGPRMEQGRLESWTLIAPYPDVALERLEPGTLIIVLRLPPADRP
jgi:hypothetical protein